MERRGSGVLRNLLSATLPGVDQFQYVVDGKNRRIGKQR
jgi:hypothetical protein